MTGNSIRDLALFGGAPAFADPLHVGSPNIIGRDALLHRIGLALERCRLTNNGPYVRELEGQIASFAGVENCVAVTNGTMALEIALRALDVTGEAIVPAMTFVATAHALRWHGIQPVFCDIDPATHNIDPRQVEKRITPRTSAVVAVHLWGRPSDHESLARTAAGHGLKLIYDASHAFACSHNMAMIGGFGDAEIYSFHATKFFHTFEGGAIVTNDGALAERARLFRNFGFAGQDRVISVGTNAKMNEISAAMGLTLMEHLDEIVRHNYCNYRTYEEGFSALPGVRLIEHDEKEKNNYQYIVICVDESAAGISRDLLLEVLRAENVLVRRYFYPGCHRMEPYASDPLYAELQLPETDKVLGQVLSFPTGLAVSPRVVERICAIVEFAVQHGEEIDAVWTAREHRSQRETEGVELELAH